MCVHVLPWFSRLHCKYASEYQMKHGKSHHVLRRNEIWFVSVLEYISKPKFVVMKTECSMLAFTGY